MSMNLFVQASADGLIKLKDGKSKAHRVTENFNLWQTPTKITRKILAKEDKLEAYTAWVLSISKEESQPIHEGLDDDMEPIIVGYEKYHYGKDHLTQLREWLVLNDGMWIEWYES